MDEIKGFMMTPAVAEKFFQRCIDREALTIDERTAIMNELVHEDSIQILKEKQLTELLKGKNVLVVKKQQK